MRRSALKRRHWSDIDEYRAAKDIVWLRDHGRCQAEGDWPEVRCGGRLDPHHIWPRSLFPERVCDPDAMTVLCRNHHAAVHHQDPIKAKALGLLKGIADAP